MADATPVTATTEAEKPSPEATPAIKEVKGKTPLAKTQPTVKGTAEEMHSGITRETF